jgi:chromosome segregation ATPase
VNRIVIRHHPWKLRTKSFELQQHTQKEQRRTSTTSKMPSADTEIFRGYENEYYEIVNKMKRQLLEVKSQAGDAKRRTLQTLDKNNETAEKLIKDMTYEANNIAAYDVSEKLKQRIKNMQRDLDQTKTEIRKNKEAKAVSERDSLLGSSRQQDEFAATDSDHKQRLIQSTNRLDRSTDSIHRSLAMIEEAEQIGIGTSVDLKNQGEQLRRTRDRIDDANQELTTGGKIIGRMSRRQITNRIILVLIIIGLLAIIGIILYFIIKPIVNKYKKKPAPK